MSTRPTRVLGQSDAELRSSLQFKSVKANAIYCLSDERPPAGAEKEFQVR